MFDYLHMMCACAMQSDSDASERAMTSITSRIKAMGYTEACVEQAIAAVGGLDIEPLVLWLLDNEVQEPKDKAMSDCASITSQIKAMGYTEGCIEQAIAAVGGLDIQPLVLWLLDNEVQDPKDKAMSRETTPATPLKQLSKTEGNAKDGPTSHEVCLTMCERSSFILFAHAHADFDQGDAPAQQLLDLDQKKFIDTVSSAPDADDVCNVVCVCILFRTLDVGCVYVYTCYTDR